MTWIWLVEAGEIRNLLTVTFPRQKRKKQFQWGVTQNLQEQQKSLVQMVRKTSTDQHGACETKKQTQKKNVGFEGLSPKKNYTKNRAVPMS